jgi:hypothetical protein
MCYRAAARSRPFSSIASGLWVTLGAGADGAKYRLYDATAPYADQIQDERFFGPSAEVGLNYWRADWRGVALVTGASIGIAGSNNAGDLNSREAEHVVTTVSPDGSTTRNVIERKTVLEGEYETYTSYPLRADVIVAPHRLNNIAFGGLTRLAWRTDAATTLEFGSGILLLRDNDALRPLGGIYVSVKDLLSDKLDDGPFIDQLRVNFVLNVSIPRIR